MKTVVVANRKGGVGKTTFSANLAVEAERCGDGPVVMVDTDEQASLTKWWRKRQALTPGLEPVPADGLKALLARLKAAGFKLVIIDTPPEVSSAVQAVIACADLVLIPTRPSSLDLEALGATIGMAEAEGRRMVFAINGAANRAKITGQAAIALSQHGTVAPALLYTRTVFAEAMTDGRTAVDLDPASKAAEEVQQLWTYVRTHLRK